MALEENTSMEFEEKGAVGCPSSSHTILSIDNQLVDQEKTKRKAGKAGILYMSTVPHRMTVTRIREIFGQYGQLGRVFLQAEKHIGPSGKREKHFTEGWIEFKSKSLAKRIAASLNNAPVAGRRRSKAAESLWNLKYLSRFKWIHLTEQLNYEKAVRKQKMRVEIAQAKREANFFKDNLEKGKNLKRLEETVLKKGGLWEKHLRQIKQRKSVKDEVEDRKGKSDKIIGMLV